MQFFCCYEGASKAPNPMTISCQVSFGHSYTVFYNTSCGIFTITLTLAFYLILLPHRKLISMIILKTN